MIFESRSFGECYDDEYYTKVIDEVAYRISNKILTNTFKFAKMAKLSNCGIYNNRSRLEAYGINPASMRTALNFKTSSYTAINCWQEDSMIELALLEARVFRTIAQVKQYWDPYMHGSV